MFTADWWQQLGLWWFGIAAAPDEIARILQG
jgi:hypothetical protein